MFGPDIEGHGGISRVARIYRDSGVFDDLNIKYLSSTNEVPYWRHASLFFSVLSFILYIFRTCTIYVHTSSWNSFYRKSIFIVLAVLFKKKCVIHIHPSHFYDFLISLKGIRAWFVFGLIRKAKNMIVLTESMKRRISELFPDSNVWVLRNPIHLERMQNIHSVRRSGNRFLYLGWYIPEKGIYELVDAFDSLISSGEDVYLELYGTKQIDEIRTYVEKKEITSRVLVNGWIQDPEKIDRLYGATALILPSHSEGIPNVILEAMSTGCPIIATRVGGLKEVLTDGYNALIINTKDSSDICEKVKTCLRNKKLTEKIAENALYQARSKYDIAVIKQDFSCILHSL
ncbi:MAG: glycosyltransferase family 4 protein [Pseudomonadota bacterium]